MKTESTEKLEAPKASPALTGSARLNGVSRMLAESVLNDFPEVSWDRFTCSSGKLTIFGWIDRPDAYKDFMLVTIDGNDIRFVTSSAKHSEEFSVRSGAEKHIPCHRVAGVLNVKTVAQNAEVRRDAV